MSINDRISVLIDHLRENENSFSKRLQVSSSAIFNIVNLKGRRSYPSGVVLDKILSIEENEKKVSAEWLMRGVGEIFLGSDVEVQAGAQLYDKVDDLTDKVNRLEEEFLALRKKPKNGNKY